MERVLPPVEEGEMSVKGCGLGKIDGSHKEAGGEGEGAEGWMRQGVGFNKETYLT